MCHCGDPNQDWILSGETKNSLTLSKMSVLGFLVPPELLNEIFNGKYILGIFQTIIFLSHLYIDDHYQCPLSIIFKLFIGLLANVKENPLHFCKLMHQFEKFKFGIFSKIFLLAKHRFAYSTYQNIESTATPTPTMSRFPYPFGHTTYGLLQVLISTFRYFHVLS